MSMDNDHALPAFPAFPVIPNVGSALRPRGGMALRDYFAAKTMAELLSYALTQHVNLRHEGRATQEGINLARLAYILADAMMEARK